METILQTIRDKDIFAVPVQLSYKGQKAFNTVAGGCISIITILAFMAVFVITLRDQIVNPDFTSRTVVNYFSYYSNSEGYKMST